MRGTLWHLVLAAVAAVVMVGCYTDNSSDGKQKRMQEELVSEGVAQTGMPAIKNFRERKILKDIYELRDQGGLVTYTYLWSDINGKAVFLGESIGYPIPYATQYTPPEKVYSNAYGNVMTPQADPNALYSPPSAEASWILVKDPAGKSVKPIYAEPRLLVTPFPLPDHMVMGREQTSAEAKPEASAGTKQVKR